MEEPVFIESVGEVFLKNPLLARTVLQATEKLHRVEKKWMKRVYRECVNDENVDMSCINDKKNLRKSFTKCVSNSFFLLSLGYEKCLKQCLRDNQRKVCFAVCKDQAFQVFNDFEPNDLLFYCHDKTFVKRIKSSNHSERVSKAFRDKFQSFKAHKI